MLKPDEIRDLKKAMHIIDNVFDSLKRALELSPADKKLIHTLCDATASLLQFGLDAAELMGCDTSHLKIPVKPDLSKY